MAKFHRRPFHRSELAAVQGRPVAGPVRTEMRLGLVPGKPALPVQVLEPELAYKVQQPELPGRLPGRPSGHPAVQTGLPSEP